ncbi:MAG: hypothetical protein HOV77_05640 [Hamadaea sp.]|uniref:hypothetical protein n=1 Tax=Hamadaea sp. TaxID=2024425 RepID=UPI0018504C49|nr:hypothetical protein [Hamadaea sp.]NUT18647.1 hypothetical protein [Hamadaea sp.]
MISGLDLGHASVTEAEHWLRETAAGLGLADLVACTHLVHGDHPRVAVSLSAAGSWPLPVDVEVAVQVAALHETRQGGRAVLYPGVDALVGTLPVAELLAVSAIQEVRVLGGPVSQPEPQTLVDTRDFVRPQYADGRLVLMAMPAPDGRIAPFEVPNPTPCCAFH